MNERKPYEEVVTHFLPRDVQLVLPDGSSAGTMVLITMDNGFDHTKPNSFGLAGLTEYRTVLEAVKKRVEAGEVQAVGLTGKPFIFAVGADLVGVPTVATWDQALEQGQLGHQAYTAMMDIGVPSFAFINGASLGGGLEIALACSYRTVSAGAPAIALPETFLGLVPGWGGCYLLPNLIGPQKALSVIIDNSLNMNKMMKGPQVLNLGIADAMFEPADFLESSIAWAAQVVAGQITVERPEVPRDEQSWEAPLMAAKMMADMKTGGQSPGAYRALDLVRGARTRTRDEAFAAEDKAVADLIMSDELRASLYAFDLVQRRAKRPAGAPDKSLGRPVTKVGIVGAGLMASQLALLFIQRLEVPVVMTDLDQERVDKGVGYVHAQLADRAKKGRLSEDKLKRYSALISGSTSKEGFADAEFVIEAVFEKMSVKKQVFAECEAVVSDTCVLATNTSSLSVTEMAADLAHPERVVGFHFFNPVAVMPLLEIIPGEQTDEATLATAFAAGKTLKKTCILVKDSPSFIVNRLLGRFLGEVSKVVDEGTPIEVADKAFAGFAPMPPFVLLGLVGPAVALHASETLAAAFPDRFQESEGLKRVVEAGKTAFYKVEAGRPKLDPEVLELLPKPENPVELTAEQVRERVLGALAEETRLMLDEGVAQSPMDIDLAMITGAGFQFWNGGLTPLLDRTGVAEHVTGKRFLPKGAASLPG
ncbi:MAG: 3-hydroxyacyl-CoA dehydrogenase [Actinomycetales bacterium]|nr:MAG: 3-hydroxyacyl-CoA dehydrogenase [Actinomycetales bacterium]